MRNKIEKKMDNKSKSNKEAFSQLAIMIGLTLITQVVTLLKTSTVASQFGATIEMDAFNFSNSIGIFIFSFIGAGITTVIIPSLVDNDKKKSVNIFISTIYSLAFIVLIVVYLSRVYIVSGLSGGNSQFVSIACNIMLITLITQFVESFLGATNAIFQCSGKFNFPKLINLVMAIVLVILIVIMPKIDIYKYSFYILITTMVNVVIQIIVVIKNGYKFKFKVSFNDIEFRKMMKRFAPTVLSTGLYQVSLITGTIISSSLGEGQLSILSYSNAIMGIINAVLLTNLMTYLYPKLAENVKNENKQNKLVDLMLLLNTIMCLIVVVFFSVGRDGIVLLYERGKFTSSITSLVYTGTLIYMIGLPINAIRDLIYRYFYVRGDTVTPFKNSLIISILNLIISFGLSRIMGINGIVLGSVITSFISLIMILIMFNNKFKFECSKRELIIEHGKVIIISIIIIFIMKFIRTLIPSVNSILNIIIYGSIIVVLYGVFIYVFKSKVLGIKL